MTIVAIESDRFHAMEDVAELSFKGHNPTQISKALNIPRKQVIELLEDYRIALSQDGEARDMARDYLNQMVKHYDALIKRFYELVEDIDVLDFNHQVAGQKNATLKSIAELEAKRLDALQKAGLLDSAELGDEMAKMEEDHQILISILREDLCPDCSQRVAHKLQKVTGEVEEIIQEATTVDAEVVE